MATADDEFADLLRAVLARFQSEAADEAQILRAQALAREMYDLLDGPQRGSWYAGGLRDDGREARVSRLRYRDRSLFRGTANPLAPPLASSTVELPDGRPAIESRVTLGRLYEGPPNGVHGGYVAGMFDDVLGSCQTLIEGPTGLTGTLTVRYRQITPIDTELVLLAWVHHVSGRRVQARATCHAAGLLTAEAEALFVRVDMDEIARRTTEQRSETGGYRPHA